MHLCFPFCLFVSACCRSVCLCCACADGLTLTRCSCAGTSLYFIPRLHVDFIATGRELYIKTLLVGVALLAYGAYAKNDAAQHPPRDGSTSASQIATALLGIGIALMILAVLAMIPSTLTISSNASSFYSTNCCNTANVSKVLAWLKMNENGNINAPYSGAQLTSVSWQPQQQPTYIPTAHPYSNGAEGSGNSASAAPLALPNRPARPTARSGFSQPASPSFTEAGAIVSPSAPNAQQ